MSRREDARVTMARAALRAAGDGTADAADLARRLERAVRRLLEVHTETQAYLWGFAARVETQLRQPAETASRQAIAEYAARLMRMLGDGQAAGHVVLDAAQLGSVLDALADAVWERSQAGDTDRAGAYDALARQLRRDAEQTQAAGAAGADGLRWEQSPSRVTWVAEHRNMVLAVTRTTAGEWKACVTSDPGSGEPFDQFSPRDYPTRLAAQRWAERTAGVTR